MRLSMMVAVGLATILLAGCASQPTDLVNSEGIAVSESRWDKEMNRLRLLFTSTGHPNHYRQQRSTDYYPQSGQSTGVYRPPRQSQSNGGGGYRGGSVDAAHHAQGHTHHHGH